MDVRVMMGSTERLQVAFRLPDALEANLVAQNHQSFKERLRVFTSAGGVSGSRFAGSDWLRH